MLFKKIAFLLLVSTFYLSYSQSERIDEFGKPTQNEFELKSYESEPDATGIILYESGNYYAVSIVKRTAVRLVKEIHRKIKVIDAKKFDYTTVEIPYYEGYGYYAEEILDYKAITHNGSVQNFVPENAFYKTKKSGARNVLTFTFPNVQDGSILEYRYTIVSPYFYDLEGWEFQHELPTIYSLFQTVLPPNFKYNRILYGNKKLTAQKTAIKKNDFLVPSNSGRIDTEVSLYAMKNVPSFTEEKYMLSKKNYISRIVYEPLAFKAFYGFDQVFTRSWEDVDKRFENDEDFGEQLTKKNYFRRKLPNEILKIPDDLERAKAVYGFIQDRYTWNGRYFNYEFKVKDAFDEKLGSVSAINLSLINALKAAGLYAKPMLLSTRQNGLPTELYPVLSNFNYVLAVLMINNERIILDATNKQAPFGVIPFPALNIQGRVMDFKNGSYWMPIEPFDKNIRYVNAQIAAEADGNFSGKLSQASYGYIGLEKRNTIAEETPEEYIKTQGNDKAGIEIDDYQIEALSDIENPLKENYNISVAPETVGDKVILYPFFNKTYISENPFKMKERSYPMNFGFPFTNTYLISIDLGDVYEVEQLPKSRTIKLPNDDGECLVTYIAEGSKINIRFNMKLNAYRFPPDAYESLKEFFGTMVTMLKDEPITLKKI
ncbi:hypothetical protein [Aequorivita lipolytica]|uniref:DUF3857 domain-containing protein n=1 Tax=Aequorivita lipolytica TaxID=153267 RepID=A0A5C6YPK0_9FLAO|nr:hypothetical protein [Aequorivita lipolytica]TXD68985.1 hypothetical protein ESV24_09550 [Aequorivita lipolytica]SRX53001.1 hypothetical protein AEQU2_02262 [Aequorivita lipolytica]